MSPSKLRRKIIWDAARDSVYKRNGAEYNPDFNPFFPQEQAIPHKQFEKAYNNWHNIYHRCESLMKEMEEVYGAIRKI